ncbi:MAG: hypothetical protein IMW88_09395 [Thermoflavifilum sp.]|uniref:CRISPR-associated endonuclease Cas6 n=1 Tax=Thermoflavifilum sp. TaxID=1968839 RepID=UPI0018A3F63B|nr:CRISPR-associated endonuclease Cas6 [Thermoflavifilum sp.]QOR75549.1 MAG: hypothetical protein IMW88_09395 [Thermoflavifilum sp.]
MKRLRTLLIRFENDLPAWQTPAFRGAVIEKVGREHILFHQHLGDEEFMYRYPLIQYKSIHQKPAILCLGEGVDEIYKLFDHKSWTIDVRDQKYELIIDKLYLGQITMNVWNNSYTYTLSRWLALNEKNYEKFKGLTSSFDQLAMLEKVLIGNILSFAKGIDWHVEQEIKVRIDEIKQQRKLKYKDAFLMGFDLRFSSNVFLPEYIGLGKGASHGFGVVRKLREKK